MTDAHRSRGCLTENKGLRGKMKGTKPRRKIERSRVKIKGAGSANDDNERCT